MKFLFLFAFLSLSSASGLSFNRPDIDTVSILGLVPGLNGMMVSSLVSCKLDTLLWDDNNGIGIAKFAGSYLGSKGEFRIAYDKGFVSQVSFVAPTHNEDETQKIYRQLSAELREGYGPADVETTNAIHEMRWEGLKQSISVKAVDGTQYVTVALSKFGM